MRHLNILVHGRVRSVTELTVVGVQYQAAHTLDMILLACELEEEPKDTNSLF